MERRSRFAGWEVHLQRNPEGFNLRISANPEYQQARQEVFQLLDQVQEQAKAVGVSALELLGHWMRTQWNGMTGKR
ncbi:MAG: hypothetical protein K6U14_06770 [Firmicutes bacterium]|nr:hypothetical protein [Alicyclobacillaceae bacterium]MCL6497324.1 hypothetical protein [Bacillota bacterium]